MGAVVQPLVQAVLYVNGGAQSWKVGSCHPAAACSCCFLWSADPLRHGMCMASAVISDGQIMQTAASLPLHFD